MKIKEVYAKFKHLDHLLSDDEWLNNSLRNMMLFNMWKAIKDAQPTHKLEHRGEPCPNCLPGMAWGPSTHRMPEPPKPEPPWEELQEIDLLKRTIKAFAKMVIHYRLGKPTMLEWVFDNIAEAKARYGEDLTKII